MKNTHKGGRPRHGRLRPPKNTPVHSQTPVARECLVNSLSNSGHQKIALALAPVHSSISVKIFYPTAAASPEFHKSVMFYITVLQDLIVDGYLSTKSKSLAVDTPAGDDVYALREIGVDDSIGIHKKASKPLVIGKLGFRYPFKDNTFDFVFSGNGAIDRSEKLSELASEIVRTLKPEGYLGIWLWLC